MRRCSRVTPVPVQFGRLGFDQLRSPFGEIRKWTTPVFQAPRSRSAGTCKTLRPASRDRYVRRSNDLSARSARAHVGSVPAMTSGGSGDCRSRVSRDAMPKPVNRTSPFAVFTRMLAGLMSLWMSPCRCILPRAAATPAAMREERPTSIGVPTTALSSSPPGSSSTRMVRPRSRTSSSGRTAHALWS